MGSVSSVWDGHGFFSALVMYCADRIVIYIANNSIFHERIKHMEVDYHFIWNMSLAKCIVMSYIASTAQIGDILMSSPKYCLRNLTYFFISS